jgi:hypothetical protein
VTGSFIPGQQITLRRPKENSPNLIPDLWEGQVLEFVAYRDRQEELTALAENIIYNLRHDGLKPSREILVIALGSGFEAMKLESAIAEFLMSQGIDIYIPSTPDCNILIPTKKTVTPISFGVRAALPCLASTALRGMRRTWFMWWVWTMLRRMRVISVAESAICRVN